MATDTILVDALLLRLEPEWGTKKIENLKLIYQLGNEKRKERIQKILTISAKKLIKDNLLNNEVLLPPSPKEECGQGEITLGTVCFGKNPDGTNRELYPLRISLEDAKQHILVSGLTGTGKTLLGLNIAVQMAQKGIPVWIVDWNRQWKSLLSLPPEKFPLVKDIRVYTIGRDISPFRYNLFFSGPKKISKKSWIEIIAEKPLAKSLLSGQGSGSLILNEAENLLEGYEQEKLHLLPNIEDIKKRVDRQFLRGRSALWKDSALRCLNSLLHSNTKQLFGSRNPMDVSKMLQRPGITILEMDIELPNSLRILFQEALFLHILLELLSRGESEKLRLFLICEEAQHLFPSSMHEQRVAGEILQNLYCEGRKMGLGLCSILQEPSAVLNYAYQCKTQIHFTNNTYKDIATVSNALFLRPHETRYLDYMPLVAFAFAKVKGRAKNCLIKTPPPLPIQKVTDEELRELSKKWQRQS